MLTIHIEIKTEHDLFNLPSSARQEVARIVDDAKGLAVDTWGGTAPGYNRVVQDQRGNTIARITVTGG